jgi:hypothetical protein
MSVTEVVAGDGINIDNTDPTKPIVSTDGTMVVQNLKSSYQSEMMNYINSYDKIIFFGDSLTFGLYYNPKNNLLEPSPYRWATLLSEYYDKKEINISYGGSRWVDQLYNLYNQWPLEEKPVCPYFMACGFNDINNSLPFNQDAILTNALASIMYGTLPSSCFKNLLVDSRDIISKTGLWQNNKLLKNFGMTLLADDKNKSGTLEFDVTGRFVIINFSCPFEDSNSCFISIDGEKIDGISLMKRLSGALYPLDFKCWIYDTKSLPDTTHNIKLNFNISKYSSVCIDYIGGFEESQLNTNPIFVAPIYNMASLVDINKPAAYPYRISYNEGMKIMCRMLRNVYKLPVYYMEDTTNSYNIYGNITSLGPQLNLTSDGLHPGKSGHEWIFNRIVNFLENGEYVYRTTM